MHAHQFWVGIASPVSEILLLSKLAKIPFETMDYRAQTGKFRGILFFFLVCYHECLALLPESIVNTTRLHNNTICLFTLTSMQSQHKTFHEPSLKVGFHLLGQGYWHKLLVCSNIVLIVSLAHTLVLASLIH